MIDNKLTKEKKTSISQFEQLRKDIDKAKKELAKTVGVVLAPIIRKMNERVNKMRFKK